MGATHSEAQVGLTEKQHAYITGLRNLADFLTEHPEFIDGAREAYGMDFSMTRDAFLEKAHELGAEEWEQVVTDSYFKLVRQFGPHQIYIYMDREKICERVETVATEWQPPTDLFPAAPVEVLP